jgi:hypothetical protein
MILKINLFITDGKITVRKIKKVPLGSVKPKFDYIIRNYSYEKIYDKYFWDDYLMGTGRQQVYLFNTDIDRIFYTDTKEMNDALSVIAKTFIRDLKIKQILR